MTAPGSHESDRLATAPARPVPLSPAEGSPSLSTREGGEPMARPTLRQHPKFRRLCHLLAVPVPHALGYLECMWSVGYQCGDPVLGDATDVELAAEWPGEPG